MRGSTIKALSPLAVAAAVVLMVSPSITAEAQEAIPTSVPWPDGGAPPAPETAPLRLSDRIDRGPDFMRPTGPCGGPARTADGKADKTPHGQVWAGVGSYGYRDIGGAVCVPLGDNAAMSLAVDAGRMNGWSGQMNGWGGRR